MLNALKLFLLPEENFNGCKKKFGFASSKGDKFEGPESFSYYFPSDNSFIILEAENVHGRFCLVLHQGNKQFSYGRLAVPCELEKIRSLFWDFTSHENERMGAPNGQLSLKFVVSALKQFGAEQIGDVKTLKERLFSEKALDPKLGRFCLLPLKQGGTVRELEAWRQLIHLAFDISAKDECTLPNAVATIIEGEKQRSAEQVSVDFDQILQAYNDLKQEGDRLQNFQNHLSDWHQFDQTYQQYGNDSKRAAQLYLNLVSSLDVCADKLEKDALDTSKRYDKKKRDFESNRQEYLKVDAHVYQWIVDPKLGYIVYNKIDYDEETKVFFQKVDALSDSFYGGIKNRCPNLSKTELRLCSMIRLKIDSQQIANLQNIAVTSVNKSRYRIRKKMDLDETVSLDEFIQNL